MRIRMIFLKSVLAALLAFFVLLPLVFAQKSVSPTVVNQKYLNSILSAAKKYISKMKICNIVHAFSY
jgi:hypothetical protein